MKCSRVLISLKTRKVSLISIKITGISQKDLTTEVCQQLTIMSMMRRRMMMIRMVVYVLKLNYRNPPIERAIGQMILEVTFWLVYLRQVWDQSLRWPMKGIHLLRQLETHCQARARWVNPEWISTLRKVVNHLWRLQKSSLPKLRLKWIMIPSKTSEKIKFHFENWHKY